MNGIRFFFSNSKFFLSVISSDLMNDFHSNTSFISPTHSSTLVYQSSLQFCRNNLFDRDLWYLKPIFAFLKGYGTPSYSLEIFLIIVKSINMTNAIVKKLIWATGKKNLSGLSLYNWQKTDINRSSWISHCNF